MNDVLHSAVLAYWDERLWSKHLVDACFGLSDPGGNEVRVRRVPATPEWLASSLRRERTRREDVLRTLVDAHRPSLVEHDGRLVRASLAAVDRSGWSTTSVTPPPFFSYLWLSCLVAWGHPDPDLDFRHRWTALFEWEGPVDGTGPTRSARDVGVASRLVGRTVDRATVGHLWEALAAWLALSPAHADLEVPDAPAHEVYVGISYGLVQPDLRDRRWLARALDDAGYAGYEPPPGPVLRALTHAIDTGHGPSESFGESLVRLRTMHEAGASIATEPMWEAVREEAIAPLSTATTTLGLGALTAFVEPVEGFDWEGVLTWLSAAEPPDVPGYAWSPDPFDPERFNLEPRSEELPSSLSAFLIDPWAQRSGLARLAREGLVCFSRNAEGLREVVTGTDASRSDVAFVRRDLVGPFVEAFGGRVSESGVEGWDVVEGPRPVPWTEAPPDPALSGLLQLQRSSVPPLARFTGGIRVGRQSFFPSPGLLPDVLAPEASVVRWNGLECEADPDEGTWHLPPAAAAQSDLEVRVEWPDAEPRIVRARLEPTAPAPPKSLDDDEYALVGEENEPEFKEGTSAGLAGGRHGGVPHVGRLHPTLRRYGSQVGNLTSGPRAVADVYGHRGRPGHGVHPFLVVLHPDELEEDGRVDDQGARSTWRRDLAALDPAAPTRLVVERADALETVDDKARNETAVTLWRRTKRPESDRRVERGDVDHQDVVSRLSRLYERKYEPAQSVHASQLMAIIAARTARAEVGRHHFVRWVDALRTPWDGSDPALAFELLAAYAESGRVELARHHRSTSIRLRGVPPRLGWSVVTRTATTAFMEGTLLGLLDPAVLERLARRLGDVAEVRWSWPRVAQGVLPRVNNWVVPLLKVLTDAPRDVGSICREELGGLFASDLTMPQVPTVAAFDPATVDIIPPAGYKTRHRYGFVGDELGLLGPGTEADGVVVERGEATRRHAIHVIRVDGRPVYASPSREWTAVRAAEAAGVPAFSRCEHGVIRSRWPLFPRLPLAVARCLTTYGLGLSGARPGNDGRIAEVEYPFGPGAAALDTLPSGWFLDLQECSCSIR